MAWLSTRRALSFVVATGLASSVAFVRDPLPSPPRRAPPPPKSATIRLMSPSSDAATADAATADDAAAPSSSSSVPSLIVFDLDNTLWTPELYQLRKLQRNGVRPVANRDVALFDGARSILDRVRASRSDPTDPLHPATFAIASRTKSVDWARDLLGQFGLADLFEHAEIYPGDKATHFARLREKTGVPYDRMLFFDDSRDGKFGNCVPVSRLGVLSVHCPGGIDTEEVFRTGMERFAAWGGKPNTVIEWDGEVTVLPEKERREGVVKRVVADRRFGFIRYGGRNTRDLFFHFNALPRRKGGGGDADADSVREGDELLFTVADDPKNGKKMATDIEIVKRAPPEAASSPPSSNATAVGGDTVKMRVFSMNLPFAALLANEYKTLETRNGTMFVPYPPGTKMLLHVGQRTYPDGDRHIDVMRSGGLDDDEIARLKSLPAKGGYGRGTAVAIVEIGRTYETTLEERSAPEFERKVGAFGADSGRMATEIVRAEYLKRPVKVSGRGGVFKADVERDVIPDGWLD